MIKRGCGRWLGAVLSLGAGFAWPAGEARALEPDELLLVVNRNVPDGKKLAERYAGARQVPDGRTVELGLPTSDDIPFAQYEEQVVPAIRGFIEENGLKGKVKCIVTFYGVPLRISRRPDPGEVEKRELAALQKEITETRRKIEPIVIGFEKLAQRLDPTFDVKITGGGSDDVSRRADRAAKVIERQLPILTDPKERDAAFGELLKVMEQLVGPGTVTLYLAQREAQQKPDMPKAEQEHWKKMVNFVQRTRATARQAGARRFDPAAREKAREIAKNNFGLLEYAGIVQGQLEYLKPGDTTACFDSELSLLWWDLYPRAAWTINPLSHASPPMAHPPMVMTCRLDATKIPTVDRMLADSIRAEQEGLDGRVAVDSRGITGGRSAYSQFDKRLTNLADLVKARSKMTLFLDVNDAVMPPGTAENVALYTGWYSVAKYVPGCKFTPGAVGYHVASFEMQSLHVLGGFWVPHMLEDGAAASLGAVAEPYLNAFPMPEEFFPLLMTGKLTLAETYWRTLPSTSWMMGLVGDPLYRPFAKKPAMRVEDLPVSTLRTVAGREVIETTTPTAQP